MFNLFRSVAARGFFCSVAAWAFCCAMVFAQSPLGLSLCSRSSREGFSFLFLEEKKRNKENSPSALFCLLRYFSTLNKKNSLRSNSFLFLTLRKAPPLHGKKVRPDLCAFSQHRFACWSVMFSFFASLVFLSSRVEQSGVKDLVYIHTTSEAMCPPKEGYSGLSGGALRKIEYFPLRTKSCLSVASSFRLGKYDDFLAPERSRQSFFLLSFSFWWQKEKVNPCG